MAPTSSPLIAAYKAGPSGLKLAHRITLSALTRLRMAPVTELPRELNALYYEQRASEGGLLVTECMYARPDGRGYVRAPGMNTDEQASAWAPVTERVHAKGGVIYAQLFHAGRVSHSTLVGNAPTVSASPVGMAGTLYVEGGVKKDYEVPRALSTEEVRALPAAFAAAAEKAIEKGKFDGVELHGGNGYLLQSFLAKKTNQRTDEYGGPIENRARLLLEVVDAVAGRIGSSRTAVKIQPGVTFSDLVEPEVDVLETLTYLAPELSKRQLAYTNLSSINGDPYWKFLGLPGPNVSIDLFRYFRSAGYGGALMINGGLSIEQGAEYVAAGVADLVSYGVPFIANPNLPQLVAAGGTTAALNPAGWNTKIWYSKNPEDDAEGYTDFPPTPVPTKA